MTAGADERTHVCVSRARFSRKGTLHAMMKGEREVDAAGCDVVRSKKEMTFLQHRIRPYDFLSLKSNRITRYINRPSILSAKILYGNFVTNYGVSKKGQ